MEHVGYYYGIFTGKMVKPLNDQADLVSNFSKGEPVLVFKAVDFIEWFNMLDKSIEKLDNTLKKIEGRYKD